MHVEFKRASSLPAKLIAAVLVAAFLALGLVGLILPVVPGLLFLVLAAALVARNIPATDRWLRKSRKLGKYLDQADGFFELGPWRKAQLAGLLCLKGLLDGIAFAKSQLTKLLNVIAARR
jgi:uncharacterized membrane protein YbaN (DUF454 family)